MGGNSENVNASESPEIPHSTFDDLLRVLANDTRRSLVSYLREHSRRPVSIETVAREFQNDPVRQQEVAEPDYETARLQLYHYHLPKLAEIGIIDFHPGKGVITYRPDPTVEKLYDTLTEFRDEHAEMLRS